jgi:hypothetical protein
MGSVFYFILTRYFRPEPLNLIGSWAGDSFEAVFLSSARPLRTIKGKLDEIDGEPYITCTLVVPDASEEEEIEVTLI